MPDGNIALAHAYICFYKFMALGRRRRVVQLWYHTSAVQLCEWQCRKFCDIYIGEKTATSTLAIKVLSPREVHMDEVATPEEEVPSYSTVRKWADESKHGRERSWRITPVVEGWSLSPHRRLLTRSLTRITQQCIATELGVSQNKVSAHLLLRLLCPDEKQIGHDMSTGNLAVLLSDQMLWTCFLGCKGSAASIRLDKGQS